VQDFFDGFGSDVVPLGEGVAVMGFGEPGVVDVGVLGVLDAKEEFFGEGFAFDRVELHGVKFELVAGHGHGRLQIGYWQL
jgi:hypothetical protein